MHWEHLGYADTARLRAVLVATVAPWRLAGASGGEADARASHPADVNGGIPVDGTPVE